MKKMVWGAVAAAIGLVAMTAVASAQVCVLGIFGAAIYVAAKEKRELTEKEALTCGISYMFDKKDETTDTAKDQKNKKKAAKPAQTRSAQAKPAPTKPSEKKD